MKKFSRSILEKMMTRAPFVLPIWTFALFVGVAASGCVFDDSSFSIQSCTTTDDCATGSTCVAGQCVWGDVSLLDGDSQDDVDVPDLGSPCADSYCSANELCCAGECIDVTSDEANCGTCGKKCAALETCEEGACNCGGFTCDSAQACCDVGAGQSSCTSLVEFDNCGGCGIECRPGEDCLGGTCACESPTGIELCATEQECCPGFGCHLLENDPLHCGACGVRCGPGEVCVANACVCDATVGTSGGGQACATGEACCGNPRVCVDRNDPICDCGGAECATGEFCCSTDLGSGNITDACTYVAIDPANCGDCGTPCAEAEDCVGGACECQAGFADCDGMPGCETRPDSNPLHCGACGNACEPGFVCNGSGACELTCPVGLTECNGNGTCVDLLVDRANCGSCNTTCDAGEVCDGAGHCALSCQAGLTDCTDKCVDLQTDRAHCGDCTTTCAAGDVCNGSGSCALSCQSGLTDCNDKCVDPLTDRANCGACGTTCDPGYVCNGAGVCTLSCQSGLTNCAGKCVDTDTDRANCGGCGTTCDAGDICNGAGSCTLSCEAGLTDCNDKCVDRQTDRANCGACGTTCNAGSVCNGSGVCALSCQSG
ncbi:MAG: hypothetical protein CO108_29060, partial [Deltaproteobacteria bacterium CG_4_9_14_3_um_filter_63_12]